MIVFYDIGTEKDLIASNFSSSIKANTITENLISLTEYARTHSIKIIRAIDTQPNINDKGLQEKLETTNPSLISLNEFNEIELKSMLIEHNGDLFIEKTGNNIFLNHNLKSILSFFYTNHIYIFGITKTEELLKTALALNQIGIKTSIIEDAIMPINMHDLNIKDLISKASQNNITLIKTSQVMVTQNGLHILQNSK